MHGNYCSNLLDAQFLVDKLSANSASFNARLTVNKPRLENSICECVMFTISGAHTSWILPFLDDK